MMNTKLILFLVLFLAIPIISADFVEVIVNFEESAMTAFDVLADEEFESVKTSRDGKLHLVRISKDELYKLEENPFIKSVHPNFAVRSFLSDSKNVIGIDELIISNPNLIGSNQTVCVVDSGIDYTHEVFGSCSVVTQDVTYDDISYESSHPYDNDSDVNITIVMENYTEISVFFERLILADNSTHWDEITIYDGQGNPVISYTGNLSNFWTPSISGNNLTVNLRSYNSLDEFGFNITRAFNGSIDYTWDCPKIPLGFNFMTNTYDVLMTYDSHGTHVAGIIGANYDLKGVSPNLTLLSAAVLDEGGKGNSLDLYNGIEWCIDNANQYDVSVISLSLGGGSYDDYCDFVSSGFTALFELAQDNNISVVVATGNAGSSTHISFPACISHAIRVGSTNVSVDEDEISYFTNRGSNFDILMAPGIFINSSVLNNGYDSIGGTSMAAPHVSGVIALMHQFRQLHNKSKLTPQESFDVLNSTGLIVYDSDSDTNYTRINAFSAIESLSGEINFNYSLSSDNLTIFDNITITWNVTGIVDSVVVNITNKELEEIFSSSNFTGNITLDNLTLNLSGVYNITIYAENELKNKTVNASFELLKITPVIDLRLNGAQDNLTFDNGTGLVNIYTLESANNSFELYIDEVLNLTNSTINTTVSFDELGFYNISVIHPESEFYSFNSESLFVNVTYPDPDGTITIGYFLSPNAGEHRNISWNTSLDVIFANFSIVDPSGDLYYFSDNLSGETGYLSHSNLVIEGQYNISLYIENAFFNTTIIDNFTYTKLIGGYDFWLSTIRENVSGDNTTWVYELEPFNVSLFLYGNAEVDLFLDGTINQSYNQSGNTSTNEFMFEEGEYNFTASGSNTSIFNPKNETIIVTVIPQPPIIENLSVEVGEVVILKNEVFNFSLDVFDVLEREFEMEWLLNGTNVSNNSYYIFNASHHDFGEYELVFIAEIDENRTSSVSWNVTVDYVPPTILSFSPSNESNIVLKQNNTIEFTQSSEDYYNQTLTVEWFINGELNSSNESFVFDSFNLSLDTYIIVLNVSNENASSIITWVVELVNNQPPVFSGMISSITVYIGDSQTLVDDLRDYFSDPDGDQLTYTLEVQDGMSENVDIDIYNHRAIVLGETISKRDYRIYASDGIENVSSNLFEIDVRPQPTSPSTSGGDTTGGAMPPPPSTSTQVADDLEAQAEEIIAQSTQIVRDESSSPRQETPGEIRFISKTQGVNIEVSEITYTDVLPSNVVYKVIEITADTNEETVVEFEVEKSWLASNELSPSDVALFKLDGDWVELVTSVVRETDTTFVYESQVPSFSIFAISKKVEEEKESNLANFLFYLVSAVFSIGAILAVIILVEKYAKKHAEVKVTEFNQKQKIEVDNISSLKQRVDDLIKKEDFKGAKTAYHELKKEYDTNPYLDDNTKKKHRKDILDYFNRIKESNKK